MPIYYKKYIQEILGIIKISGKSRFIIGIDGPGGCGKSTLAKELIVCFSDMEIVHMDDFYKPEKLRKESDSASEVGGFFNWRYLEETVLIPFMNNSEISFQKYDWESGYLKYRQKISKDSNIIVEGVYATRQELSKYYDVRIWMDCSPEICIARGVERDGIEMKEYWQNVWMKQENEYIEKHKPYLQADIKINSIDTGQANGL